MVEMPEYDSPRTNQGPLRRTLVVDATMPRSVHRWDRRQTMCGSIKSRFHLHPTLSLVEKVSLPAQPMNSSTECRCAGYGSCVDRWCVDATVVPHLDNLKETSPAQSLTKTTECRMEGGSLSTHRQPVDRGLVCEGRVSLLNFEWFHLIN